MVSQQQMSQNGNAGLNMIVGQKYLFTYRSDAQRKDHYSVLAYLAETREYYVLNARPYAGTQEMPKRWVKRIERVDSSVSLMIDGRVLRA